MVLCLYCAETIARPSGRQSLSFVLNILSMVMVCVCNVTFGADDLTKNFFVPLRRIQDIVMVRLSRPVQKLPRGDELLQLQCQLVLYEYTSLKLWYSTRMKNHANLIMSVASEPWQKSQRWSCVFRVSDLLLPLHDDNLRWAFYNQFWSHWRYLKVTATHKVKLKVVCSR